MLCPELVELKPNATLADLPCHAFRVNAETLGAAVADALEQHSELPGVIVDQDTAQVAVISRQSFFQQMSRGFSREIYLRRPITVLLRSIPCSTLWLGSACDIREAAALALGRAPQLVYEPILVGDHSEELQLLDAHVLLLAQTQLLGLANRTIQQQKEAAESANRALREAQAALVQREKLASLGRLAAGLAHELNNPVAFVTNNLAVLHREIAGLLSLIDAHVAVLPCLAAVDAAAATALANLAEELDLSYIRQNFNRQIQASSEGLMRVRNVVRNLCDFARLDRAEWEHVDLNHCLRSTVDMLSYELKLKELRLQTDCETLPTVFVQPGKINQVFLNLLLNAMSACAPGGTITVRTRPDAARGVCIDIEDDGCGINSDNLPHVFEPFFTTRPVGQGMGLGLSISYGIVREHGGAIEVESAEGRGSLFRVHLPLQPPRREEGLLRSPDSVRRG